MQNDVDYIDDGKNKAYDRLGKDITIGKTVKSNNYMILISKQLYEILTPSDFQMPVSIKYNYIEVVL